MEDSVMLFKVLSEAISDASIRGKKVSLIFDVTGEDGKTTAPVQVTVEPALKETGTT